MAVAATLLLALGAGSWAATPPADEAQRATRAVAVAPAKLAPGQIETRGGELRIRWNHVLLGNLGLRVDGGAAGFDADGAQHFALDARVAARWNASGRALGDAAAGAWQLEGGPTLILGKSPLSLRDARITVRSGTPLVLDVRDARGRAWFYVDQLMYVRAGDPDRVEVQASDLRISPELAKRLGQPGSADLPIGDLAFWARVDRVAELAQPKSCGNPNWPGEPAPNGGTYLADVFMYSFAGSHLGCQACDGPGGAEGLPKFAPSSTLVNNRNQGAATATIVGDPLGTSSALWTADVPWNSKFTSPLPPYGNDQHPYLIWNLYRIGSDGSISQIGRSGVKHAFLTVNTSPFSPDILCESCNGGHVLGIACGDTYGAGTNDSNGSLGPRREIIPATGQWGRCGSIFDDVDDNPNDGLPGCDGTQDSGGGSFENRMLVRESSIDALANPGATWRFESWYIVREDINPYNTMANRPVGFSWSGSVWSMSNQTPSWLGPVIDQWVAPGISATSSNHEIVGAEGRTKVAVRAIDLGNGSWRYHYAVMNVDFARAVTENAEPNLRVLSNRGFDAVTIPVYALNVSDLAFDDGDGNAGNDWTSSSGSGSITWAAPVGNTLDWGTLFRFSFTADAAPTVGEVVLDVAEAGSPGTMSAPALLSGVQSFFANGFEEP